MSNRAVVYFNTGESNGRRTTFNGAVEVVRNGEETDLYIRGPKGGLRHVVCMPWHEAVHLGEELLRLHEDKNPETEDGCSRAASGDSI